VSAVRGERICQLVKDYGKTRPCIVVQSVQVSSESLLVIPLTDGNLRQWRVAVAPSEENGLSEAGRDRKPVAMTEKVQPVHPKRLRIRIGTLEPQILAEIDEKRCLVQALTCSGNHH
jgi:mRNA-degrading endonuclease toxin of MazEF toxin-antitoxin module